METQSCKRELVIEIPPDVVRQETESVTAQYQRVARIPGFRPGHAPASLVRTRFRKDIQSEVVQSLIPKYFENAVRDQKLAVVGQPRFEELKFEADQPITCKATFEILPEFEVKDYRGLAVEQDTPQVEDADVEKTLERLRENAAAFEVVSDRPAADQDFVTVNYQGQDTGDPKARPVEAREAIVHLAGEGMVAAFTEQLRGARTGEVREFDVQYPEDFPQKALAGRNYHYRVEIQAIRRKVLPDLDDEFAKSVSEFQTLAELRAKVREDLLQGREQRAVNAAKQKLLEKLMETHPFPVPETLVEAQLDRKLESTLTRLIAQGVDPRTIDVDWRKVREESRPDAEKDVRGSLLLERIAEAEKLEVSEEELDEAIRALAADRQEAPAALKTRLTREGTLDTLRSSRRNQKALDFIYQSATINRKAE